METNESSSQFGQPPVDFDQTRIESDQQLIEGGATKNEKGELKITDKQWEHIHKQMLTEMGAKEESVAGYIISHIEMDLGFQPEIKKEVAKTLIGLLDASKGLTRDQFLLQSVLIVDALEQNLRAISSRNLVILHESKKAAMNFTNLDDDQREKVKAYLEQLMGEPEEKETTLEQFMSERLGLKSKEIFDIDAATDPQVKMMGALGIMMMSGNLEDFKLELFEGQDKSDEEIGAIIEDYYRNKGYEINKEKYGTTMHKGNELLYYTISNFGSWGGLMISISRMPF